MLILALLGCPSDPDPRPPRGDDDDLPPTGDTAASTTPDPTAPPTPGCPAVTGLTEAAGPLLLERALRVSLDGPADVWVACTSPDDPQERHLLESEAPADAHAFALRGLLADTAYRCVAHAACGGAPAEATFTTDRPADLPVLTATHTPGEVVAKGYLLFNEMRGCSPSSSTYAAMVDPDGRLRWVYEVGTDLVLDVDLQLQADGTVHIGGGWGIFDEGQANRGVFRDVDLSGQVVLERALPDYGLGFNHHSERLPDGTYLTLTGDRDTDGREAWNGVGVEQWSPTLGVVFQWNTQALALAGELAPPGRLDRLLLPSPYHANAVTFLDDALGPAMWLSIYGTEELWRVDRATGERTHVFGAGGDFALSDVSGAPLPDREFPWVQHGPDHHPDGRVLLYDNGVGRPGGGTSRVAEYLLDLRTNEATLLWSWTEPGWNATVVGDADWLPNGNVLVTQGFSVCAELLPNDVSEIVELRPPDTVVSRWTWPNAQWGVYRSERYDGCSVFHNARWCDDLAARWEALGAP